MIVFAILGLLIGLLFMFVRQKLSALESKVNLLTDTVQTMAGLNRLNYVEEDDEDEDEDEDEEEEDSDDEEEVKDEINVSEPEVINLTWEVTALETDPEPEVKTITLEKRVVSDDNVDYESLTLKELKDKVTELNGPNLRTKKELIDFLKK